MGCVAPAVPSKLGWVPHHCWRNGVGSPLFLLFFCVVGYPQNWGKQPRYIDRIENKKKFLILGKFFCCHLWLSFESRCQNGKMEI